MKSFNNLTKNCFGGLFAAMLSLLSISAAHAQVLTSYNGGAQLELYGFSQYSGTNIPAQTFTISSADQLSQIGVDLEIYGTPGETTSLTFNLLSTSDGVPTSTVLGTSTLTGLSVSSSPELVFADFSSQDINLTAGQYAFSLSLPNSSSNDVGAGAIGDIPAAGTYPGGQAYNGSSSGWVPMGGGNYEIGFEVTGTALTPEPSTWALLLGGLGLLAFLHLRTRRISL
jgi:hypothetical protein